MIVNIERIQFLIYLNKLCCVSFNEVKSLGGIIMK